MRKFIFSLSLAFLLLFVGLGSVSAANLRVKLQQPKTPTNLTSFTLTFVTLDTENRSVTVRCYKKGPSDGAFVQFGSDITITPNGGNSGSCHASDASMGTEGTYQFQVSATADADSADSNTVSVDYSTSGPGTPVNYGKEKPGSCTYKIMFRSADDAGKTVKIEIYRSTDTSFYLDNSTRVGSVSLTSNTDAEFLNDVPDCGATYYYVVRAFDSAGNGSGSVGDSVVVTVGSTTTVSGSTVTPQAALPAEGTTEDVLGAQTDTATGSSIATPSAGPVEQTTPAPDTIDMRAETPETLGSVLAAHPYQTAAGLIIAGVILNVFARRIKKNKK